MGLGGGWQRELRKIRYTTLLLSEVWRSIVSHMLALHGTLLYQNRFQNFFVVFANTAYTLTPKPISYVQIIFIRFRYAICVSNA